MVSLYDPYITCVCLYLLLLNITLHMLADGPRARDMADNVVLNISLVVQLTCMFYCICAMFYYIGETPNVFIHYIEFIQDPSNQVDG